MRAVATPSSMVCVGKIVFRNSYCKVKRQGAQEPWGTVSLLRCTSKLLRFSTHYLWVCSNACSIALLFWVTWSCYLCLPPCLTCNLLNPVYSPLAQSSSQRNAGLFSDCLVGDLVWRAGERIRFTIAMNDLPYWWQHVKAAAFWA